MTSRPRTIRSVLATLAVLTFVVGAVAIVLATSSSVDLTKARIERDVALGFSNQYRQQQRLLGHADAGRADATASCAKGGSTVADKGPGRDWVCDVAYTVPGSNAERVSHYELNARTEGCFTATDPKLTAGHQFVTDHETGKDVDNPLYQFDGCFPVT